MPWLKLCDSYRNHNKVRKAGLLAAGLHAALLSYSGDTLSDGVFHPDDLEDVWPWGFEAEQQILLEMLAPVFERALGEDARAALQRELQSFRLDPREVLERLLARLQTRPRGERAALVIKHGRKGKCKLYNYEKYNPTRAQHEARLAADAERKRRQRDRRKAESHALNDLCAQIVQLQVGDNAEQSDMSRRESARTDVGMDGGMDGGMGRSAPLGSAGGGAIGEVLASGEAYDRGTGASPPADAVLSTRPDPRVTHARVERSAVGESGRRDETAAPAEQAGTVGAATAQVATPSGPGKGGGLAVGHGPNKDEREQREHRSARAAQAGTAANPLARRAYGLLRTLGEHEVLELVATPQAASLCARAAQMFQKSDAEVEQAIKEVARDALAAAAAARPLPITELTRRLASYVQHARVPNGVDGGLSEAEIEARKVAAAHRAAAERAQHEQVKRRASAVDQRAELAALMAAIGDSRTG